MAKFQLEIELDNEGMNSAYALAEALDRVAHRIYEKGYAVNEPIIRGIMDKNGKKVGYWKILPEFDYRNFTRLHAAG